MSDKLIGEFPSIPKQLRALEKRAALLKSGRILFVGQGYEHTTAKDIASHAGVAVGTFYRYFSDKRQLLMSLLEDKLESMIPPEPKWVISDPQHFLTTLLREYDKQRRDLGLYRLLPELLMKDSELAAVVTEARRKIHNRILEGLKQAREKGYTWEDLDLSTIAWTIMAIVDKMPDKLLDSGSESDYAEIAKIMCRIVFPPDVLNFSSNNG